jgi:hypothetical protein
VARYETKAEYVTAIRQLQLRAQRSGWNLKTTSREQIASWLQVSKGTLPTLNRMYGISIDDIRAGRV